MLDQDGPFQELIKGLKFYSQSFGTAIDFSDKAANQYFEQKIRSQTPPADTFYLVFNLKEGQFTHSHGLSNFFGYPEISFRDFFDRIAPSFRIPFAKWGMASYEVIQSPEFRPMVRPLKQEYRSMVPLRNASGQYYWSTQIATAFQLDQDNNLISHLNTYRVSIACDEKKLGSFQAEFFEKYADRSHWNQALQNEILKNNFTAKELAVLSHYANGVEEAGQVARLMNQSIQSIYSYNKAIIQKAQQLFFRHFSQCRHLALYLKEEGYLPIVVSG